jgi:hypothetical protein
MTLTQILLASILTFILVFSIYKHITFIAIKECYANWFRSEYWTSYNIVEAASWFAKAIVIVPGLVFGINVWQLYLVTLFTSAMLIWVSEKKVLPTLVGFNTLWIWLSLMVIAQHLVN